MVSLSEQWLHCIWLISIYSLLKDFLHKSWGDNDKQTKSVEVSTMQHWVKIRSIKRNLSGLIQDIKGNSSKWINEKRFIKPKFEWQAGYGAFSYSKSQASRVIIYIKNQEIHHRKISFLQEYKVFLEKFEVPYDERYIFKIPE